MTVTISDIAKEAGVAHTTVSRVLNGRGKNAYPAAARRAEHIRQLAHEMGYRPNASARATRTGRFGNLALLVTTDQHRSTVHPTLLGGISRRLSELDLHLSFAQYATEQLLTEASPPKILREWMADGLLINYTHGVPDRVLSMVEDNDFPAVWVNNRRAYNCVHVDEIEAADRVTSRLLESDCRHVVYTDLRHPRSVDPEKCHHSVVERERGYLRAMERAGLEPEVIRTGQKLIPADRPAVFEHLGKAANRGRVGVIAYSPGDLDNVYVASIRGGWSMAVTAGTFSAKPHALYDVRVLTAKLPFDTVGIRSVDMLREVIETPGQKLPPIAVVPEVVDSQDPSIW